MCVVGMALVFSIYWKVTLKCNSYIQHERVCWVYVSVKNKEKLEPAGEHREEIQQHEKKRDDIRMCVPFLNTSTENVPKVPYYSVSFSLQSCCSLKAGQPGCNS